MNIVTVSFMRSLSATLGLTCIAMGAALHLSVVKAEEPAAAQPLKLFNGQNLTGWKTKGNWLVQDEGVLAIEPRKGEGGWQRYDAYLTTEKTYKDFVLSLEYKLPRGGNSGVFFRVKDPANPVSTGIEAQIIDTFGKEKLSAHDCGGIIGAAAPSKNAAKRAGEWNTMKIDCRGTLLKLWLNGEQVIDVNLKDTAMKDRPAEGFISLQDHGMKLWFRNITLETISP